MTLLVNSSLGPYEIVDLLGAGGMGEVYRARDPRLGREVAIKVLPSEVAADSPRLSLFEREARAVAALNHPNILTVHDVGTHDGTPYVVTELLEGETLRELASRRTPTLQQILTYMLQAARGLEAAHARGIVHRDLKPENLFLTTDGRVKVLDFGLAKLVQAEVEITSEASTAAQSTPPGQVAGTVLYMSPEQARAMPIDARSDVFSFGVVLYELLAGKHPFRKDTVAGTLTAIVEETPPELESLSRAIPPSVGGIVRRCLEKAKEERYASGHDVAMVLETVLAAPSGAAALREVEERSPYPGLSSFTERDAAVYFGREREVEELWRRIPGRKLLAVIGPSGAGKSSFVHAGLLPRRPEGWAAVVASPGSSPERNLAQSLARELAGDAEAMQQLLRFDEADTVVETVSRWRRGHGEALVVVDQFEELFTLNPPEVQERFSGLLGRLGGAADVHVLLSLRDDFLIRSCEQGPLAPTLEGLMALLELKPEDLRRAIEEPARKRGYRFEDEALVEEMVQSVEGARAALPLLAFAVSRLWEKRDREKRTLTRAAYEEIGGVAGALAQHAEATMDRIGVDRQEMVREVFRNLVTAQGTRAVMDREELLSAFPDREAAEAVLRELIEARLLTSYEATERPPSSRGAQPEAGDEGSAVAATHRVEVVHESLLKAWPRLVRWQTQDEDGAQLRDQLKQAAHLWQEKGRTSDVLWTGAAYQEFELWRDRYPGQLTAVEEEYAHALVARARRQRRVRRGAVTLGFLVMAAVATAIWISRQEAVAQARRAEASKLVAVAEARLDDDPTEALAYTTASLELADTPEGRMGALRALWEAPPASELVAGQGRRPSFSPDGRWLALAGHTDKVLVWRDDGEGPLVLPGHEVSQWGPNAAGWTPAGLLVTGLYNATPRVHVWSFPGGTRLRSIEFPEPSWWEMGDERVVAWGLESAEDWAPNRPGQEDNTYRVRSWPVSGGEPTDLGRIDHALMNTTTSEPHGRGWLYTSGDAVYYRPDPLAGPGDDRLVAHLGGQAFWRGWGSDPTRRFVADDAGTFYVLGFGPEGPRVEETFPVPHRRVQPDPTRRWASEWPSESEARVYAISPWREARPLRLRRAGSWYGAQFTFDPRGDWYVASTASMRNLTFWALPPRAPLVVGGYRKLKRPMAFSPEGKWLATGWSDDTLRLWPLPGAPETEVRFPDAPPGGRAIDFDPQGRYLVAAGNGGRIVVVPLDGSPAKPLEGFPDDVMLEGVAVSPRGRFVASASGYGKGKKTLRVWDLEEGRHRAFDLPVSTRSASEGDPQPTRAGFEGAVFSLFFSGEKTLLASAHGGLWRWSLEDENPERILAVETAMTMVPGPRPGTVLTSSMDDESSGVVTLRDLDEGTERVLAGFGQHVSFYAFALSGSTLATGDQDGVIRVGNLEGRTPHLLLGHEGPVDCLAISPDHKWIASTGEDNTLRLWPMPDLEKPPLHALPHEDLVAKLKSLTNLRAVRDPESSTGWSIEVGPFPGWQNVPKW